jgi:hypothetical protein
MAINADKLLNKSSGRLAMQKAQQEKMIGGGPANIVLSKKSIKGIEGIKINVIKIENILKGSLALDKKQLDDKKKATSKKRKDDIETKLETKPNVESGKVKMPSAPRMGILDFIKNFIGNVLLGYFAVRLIKHLPKIMPIVKFLGNAADFIIDVGGKLLNGLLTFAQKGQEAHDKTRGFIKNLGGENFAKGFDRFIGAIDTALFLTTVLAGSMAMEAMSGGGGGGGPGGPDPRRQPTRTTSGGRTLDTPNIRNPLRQKPTVTTGGATPRPMSGGPKITGAARAGGGQFKLPSGGSIRSGGIASLVMLIPDLINSGMLVSQGRPKDGIRTLLSAIAGVGAGMAAIAGVTAGAAALGITGVGIPAAIALAIAGFAASSAASFLAYEGTDALLKKMGLIDNDPKTGKPYAYRSGGITRGGRSKGRVKRTLSKGKYKRVLAPQKPSKTELKTEAFTKNKNLKESTEELDKTKYFGPILAVSSKIMNKEEPTDRDYQNVGLGINLLIAKGIQDGQLKGGIVAKFAGGGLVDPDVLSAAETGGDISNWVAKTFRGAIETGAQRTMRLMKEMREKKAATSSSPSPGFDGGELETAGGAVAASEFYKEIGANLDQWDIYRNSVALIESGGKYSAMGGSGDHFDGRYQMGAAAKTDGSKVAGISNPGHSSDPNAHVRISYRNNPQLQETVFTGFTIANHRYLMRNPKYKSASVERKLEILGYAHNQGMGGAERWMTTGVVGVDGFGTKGTKYTDLIAKNFRAKKSGGAMELAQGAIPVTTGAQSLSRGTITSYFGSKEGFRKKAHEGVDIGLNQGTPLSFKMKGTVIDSFRTSSTDREAGGGYGSYMDVKFENGQILRLAHLSKIYPHKKFEPGNVVGLSGGTPGYPGSGRSGGPHLHLEQHSSKIGLEETLKGKLDPIKYGGFGLVQTGGVIKKFALGGRIHGLTFAMLGERGPEFVFDANTTAGLDKLAPQLLEKLNFASTKPQLASILQSYASYDTMPLLKQSLFNLQVLQVVVETIIVPVEVLQLYRFL